MAASEAGGEVEFSLACLPNLFFSSFPLLDSIGCLMHAG